MTSGVPQRGTPEPQAGRADPKRRRSLGRREKESVYSCRLCRWKATDREGIMRQVWLALSTRRVQAALGFLLALALLFLALVVLPHWQVKDFEFGALERFEAENEARKTIAQIVGGLVVLWVAALTLRRVKAAERTVEVSQEGQITERFTRAIDQLGSKSLEGRLGGIYALERIARDSRRDHWPIMEVLTAFVRSRARWEEPEDDSNATEAESEPLPPRADVQAILTVLGRRKLDHERGERLGLDLRAVDLRRVRLAGAHLEKAELGGAHLEEAKLKYAHLEDAKLRSAHLEKANLEGAYLEKAKLARANLRSANLRFANLRFANLRFANLRFADLQAIVQWSDILELELANIYGVKNPPHGFVTWAIDRMGAVSVETREEWEKLLKKH